VVRFNFIFSAVIGSMLTTCASPSRVVWEYYDQCARENPAFLAMAECGKQKRLAECVPNNGCSPEGNMFMDYIDTLGRVHINPLMSAFGGKADIAFLGPNVCF
jgi:hypothetical protein